MARDESAWQVFVRHYKERDALKQKFARGPGKQLLFDLDINYLLQLFGVVILITLVIAEAQFLRTASPYQFFQINFGWIAVTLVWFALECAMFVAFTRYELAYKKFKREVKHEKTK